MTINELKEILTLDKPSELLREKHEELFELIPELENSYNFAQNNPWHIYDVFEHTLHVIDNVPNNIEMRLSALFHDIGKPYTYTEDEKGIGHFYGHYQKSFEIYQEYVSKYNLPPEPVSKLIYNHDRRFNEMRDIKIIKALKEFTDDEVKKLFQLKRADLLGQNPNKIYILKDYEKEEQHINDLRNN